jgi:tetratricopeptide (TPR) repeat protein
MQNIKSYKLSPQLRSELNFSKQKSRLARPPKIPKIPWGKIPWKRVGIILAAFAVIIGAYVGVKKTYEYTLARSQEKQKAELQAYQNHLQQIKDEVASQGTDAYSYAELSQKFLKAKDAERAEAAAEIAVQKEPNWRDGYLNLGQVYLSINKFEEAKKAFEKAIEIDPISGTAHYYLSLAYQELRNSEAAKQEFAKAKKFGFETDFGG